MGHQRSRRISPRRAVAVAAALAAGSAVTTAQPANAYCLSGVSNYYSSSESRLSSNIPNAWYNSLENAAHSWNGHANWWMDTVPPDFIGPVRGVTDLIDFSANGLPDIPARMDVYWASSTEIYGGTMEMNSDWDWFTDGTMSQVNRDVDVHSIASHEYGHLIHLNHPGTCGWMTTAEEDAVMNPDFRTKWSINSDDIAGLQAVMGT